MTVKRYSFDSYGCDSCGSYMEIDDLGRWVSYDDYAALEAELLKMMKEKQENDQQQKTR